VTPWGPYDDEVVGLRRRGIGAAEWREIIVPVAGGGHEVVLRTEVRTGIGGPCAGIGFSPDGAQVLATYTCQDPGTWLFDAAAGNGR